MQIKTKSGFKFEFDKAVLNDWNVIEAIAMADNNSNTTEQIRGIVNLSKILLGSDLEKLKAHIASKNDGHVPIEVMSADVMSIIEAAGQGN